MDVSDLYKISNKLLAAGLSEDATELDGIISLATSLYDYNNEIYISELMKALDVSGKELHTKDDILSAMNQVASALFDKQDRTMTEVRSSAYNIATGILNLMADIEKLKIKVSQNPNNELLKRQYNADVTKLAAAMAAFRKMDGDLPGAPNPADATAVREMLGDNLDKAQALLSASLADKYSGRDYKSEIIANIRETVSSNVDINKYISLLNESLNDRRQELTESAGMDISTNDFRNDSTAADLFSALTSKHSELSTIKDMAIKHMESLSEISAIDPASAKEIVKNLGKEFHVINDLARRDRDLERSR